jgi:hypothetical protein
MWQVNPLSRAREDIFYFNRIPRDLNDSVATIDCVAFLRNKQVVALSQADSSAIRVAVEKGAATSAGLENVNS